MKCVYGIINLINGKKYIGSTSNFGRRKNEHLSMLRNNKHHSLYLQNAFNKYGESNFKFIILEKLTKEQVCYEVEQLYLDKFQTYNKTKGYNIAEKANSPVLIGCKKIYQYDLFGNLINIFDSISLAAEYMKSNYTGISHCANEKNKSYKRFIWLFEKDCFLENIKRRISLFTNGKHSNKTKEKMKVSAEKLNRGFCVIQTDLNNNFIAEFSSLNKASKETKISLELILGCCNGKYKQGKGFKWKYKNE